MLIVEVFNGGDRRKTQSELGHRTCEGEQGTLKNSGWRDHVLGIGRPY